MGQDRIPPGQMQECQVQTFTRTQNSSQGKIVLRGPEKMSEGEAEGSENPMLIVQRKTQHWFTKTPGSTSRVGQCLEL